MLRGVLDDASGKWGIRVTRVEIKAIDPPKSVKDAMEKQMRAEREKRAAILTAEGVRQSKILTAEGEKQSAILTAEGVKQSARSCAPKARRRPSRAVFQAVHDNDPDPKLLAYQYLQTLPQLAQGAGNTFWVIPSEVTTALRSVASAFGGGGDAASAPAGKASKEASRREPPAASDGGRCGRRGARRQRARCPGACPGEPGRPGRGRCPERHAGRRLPGASFVDPLGSADPAGAGPTGARGLRHDPGQRPVLGQRHRDEESGPHLSSSTSALPMSAAMTMTTRSRTGKCRSGRPAMAADRGERLLAERLCRPGTR